MTLDPRLAKRRDSALRTQRGIRVAAALTGTLAVGGFVGIASRNPATAATATTKAATTSKVAPATAAPTPATGATAQPTSGPTLSTPAATVAPAATTAPVTVTGGSKPA